ncbi:hypothetical protein GLOIN_2v1886689 [Rhizophagus clarus]|uniref:Aspartic peptidase DDI1-type domain-containing protein n=1 Tax=Rhizophagus clarus TaxID=94130 RepID=A0A8H3KYU8_9GLOM|nr:hypothetical protein GLOIN_2v1886689 [Rhizophagus clarus]
MNQYNIRMMAKFYDTQDNITKTLAKAEKYTLSQNSAPSSFPIFLSANPYVDTNRSGSGMTKNEIEGLIKTTMASSQPQQNTDLQAIAKSFQESMSRATKTLDNSKKTANKRGEDLIIRRFLSELVRTKSNKQPEDDYNYNPVDDITDTKKKVKQKSSSKKSSSKEISRISEASKIPLEETIRKVLHMAVKIVSQNDLSPSSKDSDESSLEKESLDDPMEIDFIKKKELKTSVATVECKIKRLKIPAMTLDSGAEPPIISKNIVVRIKAKIDESEKYDLSGIATIPIESIGIVRNLPITLAPGLTIYKDFIVVDYYKPTLIFSNQLLKKYKCTMDWDTNELKISLNGKDYIILVTMHKVKNKLEVNCVRTTSKCDDLPAPDCILHDLQDSSEDDTLKKK